MSALRLSRAALRVGSAAAFKPVQRRGYADAVSDKIKLSLSLPHQAIYKSTDVVQVNIAAETGEMGILAQHVPSIEQLKPGLVEVIEESGGSKQFFLSGGFAVVQPNSVLSINAVEGYPLEEFSSEAVNSQISEAQKIASGNGSEQDIAEAKIELEILESLQAALNPQAGTVADRIRAFQGGPPFTSPRKQNQSRADQNVQSPRKSFSRPRPSVQVEKDEVGQKTTAKNAPASRRTSRRRQSMEILAGEPSRFADARSRLRSVIDDHEEKPNSQRSRAYTLAELNHMLDDAIGGNVDLDGRLSSSMTEEATPKANVYQDQPALSDSQRQSHSQERNIRSSLDSAHPRSSGSSEHGAYDDEKNALYWPHLITRNVPKRPHTSHSTRHASTARVPTQVVVVPPQANPVPVKSQFSPVRQRAAMFESLGPVTVVHGEDCGPSQHPHINSTRSKQEFKPPLTKVHKIKLGNVIDERPGTPLIPLTLPQMVSPRELPTSSTPQTDNVEVKPAESNTGTVTQDRQRKPSMGWPFRWGIFNKNASTQHEAQGDAPTDAQSTAKVQPETESKIVKSRVQDLLLAAKERDEEEKKRWNLEKDRMSRRHSRFPTMVVKDPTAPEQHVEPQSTITSQPSPQPPSESAPPAKPSQTLFAAESEVFEQKTPLERAMTEKQVLSPMSLPQAMTESETSPRKSTPQTPIRGRSRRPTHRISLNGQEHPMESQVSLSSRRSRSVSRTGAGGGVRVEVEVRDSPEREARERGEKIVIIRANVEDLVREE
ncbi:hypothetical protein LTR84_003645 [Exophiala bonariae]|uniref:ATP synthase subunit delta, mitochondrial n=1 Tax=Exophiala bonariae TaxID=1690606 RepID=A0AAV9N5N4_9EURO|nr:hypothetical protein LTR84_003645 [Exophiala bonariae]